MVTEVVLLETHVQKFSDLVVDSYINPCARWYFADGSRCPRPGFFLDLVVLIAETSRMNVKLYMDGWSMLEYNSVGNSTELDRDWIHISSPESILRKERNAVADPVLTLIRTTRFGICVNIKDGSEPVSIVGIFNNLTWLAYIFCALLVILAGLVIRRSPQHVPKNQLTISKMIYDVYLSQRLGRKWKRDSARVLITVWAYAMLLVYRFYKKQMFHLFSIDKAKTANEIIDRASLTKFLKERQYRLLKYPLNMVAYRFLLEYRPLKNIFEVENLIELPISVATDPFHYVSTDPGIIHVSQESDLRLNFIGLKLKNANIVILADSPTLFMTAYLPKHAWYGSKIRILIDRLREVGVLSGLGRKYNFERAGDFKTFSEQNAYPLQLMMYENVLFTFAALTGLAVAIALKEVSGPHDKKL